MLLIVYGLVVIHNINLSTGENTTYGATVAASVNDVADGLVALLRGACASGKRERSLRNKLARINRYVLNKDHYSNVLLQHARGNLSRTNFHTAMQEQDHFLMRNESKNLYSQMKEKLSRKDVLMILKAHDVKQMKSARRMNRRNFVTRKWNNHDEAIDKFLAGASHDDHKFRMKYGPYWDPTPELKERQLRLSGRRIFHGQKTTVNNYPFIVSVHILNNFICSGVIYWVDLILTTSSCLQLLHNNRFFRENPLSLTIRVGSNHSRFGGEVIPALEIYFHPTYNPKTLENDIAIIRLLKALKMSYHRVPKAIDISHEISSLSTNVEVMILGWGVAKTSQRMSFEPKFLQRTLLPVFPNKLCKELVGERFVSRSMFCAGTMSTGEGPCNHDGGGPAIVDGKLVGLISYGPPVCGAHGIPSAFTLIGAYANWIETIKESIPKEAYSQKRTTKVTLNPYFQFLNYDPDLHAHKHKKESENLSDYEVNIDSLSSERLVARDKLQNDIRIVPIDESLSQNKRPWFNEATELYTTTTIQPEVVVNLSNVTKSILNFPDQNLDPKTMDYYNNYKYRTRAPEPEKPKTEDNQSSTYVATRHVKKYGVTSNLALVNAELSPILNEGTDVNYDPMDIKLVNSNNDYLMDKNIEKSFTTPNALGTTEPDNKGKFVPGMPPYDDYIPIPNEELSIKNINDLQPQKNIQEQVQNLVGELQDLTDHFSTDNTLIAEKSGPIVEQFFNTTTETIARGDGYFTVNNDQYGQDDLPPNHLELSDRTTAQDNIETSPPEDIIRENQVEEAKAKSEEATRYTKIENEEPLNQPLNQDIEPLNTNPDQRDQNMPQDMPREDIMKDYPLNDRDPVQNELEAGMAKAEFSISIVPKKDLSQIPLVRLVDSLVEDSEKLQESESAVYLPPQNADVPLEPISSHQNAGDQLEPLKNQDPQNSANYGDTVDVLDNDNIGENDDFSE